MQLLEKWLYVNLKNIAAKVKSD